MDVNSSNLCRLCFDEGNINIFDENGQMLEISTKIQQHLDCEVYENDTLPKCVCSVCWNQIRSFDTFYEFVKSAQNTFLLKQVKLETSSEIAPTPVQHVQLPTHKNQMVNELIVIEDANVMPECEMDSMKTEPIESILAEAGNMCDKVISKKKTQKSQTKTKRRIGRPRKIGDNGVSKVDVSNVIEVNQSQSNETIDFEFKNTVAISRSPKLTTSKSNKARFKPAKRYSRLTLSDEYKAFVLQNFDLSCDMCSAKDFTSFLEVKNHYLDEHQIKRGYIKSCCNNRKKLYLVNQVMDHVNYHLNPDLLKCKMCDHQCNSWPSLRTHIKFSHEDKGRFKCDICGQTSGRVESIKIHILRAHVPKNPDIKCDECGREFSCMKVLKDHKRIIHVKQYTSRRTPCDICGKEINAVVIERHRATHAEDRLKDRAQCDICFKWFVTAGSLQNHKNLAHVDAKLECIECHKMFRTNYHLKWHTERMHRERPHKCLYCPSAFTNAHELKRHTESHTRTKQFLCMFCEKIFYVYSSRRAHYKSHHRAEFEELKQQKRIDLVGE